MEVTNRVPIQYWSDAYKNGEYLEKWDYKHPAQELIGTLVSINLETGAKILDLGCGGGHDAIYMASQGYQVTAIDISKDAIAIARERAEAAKVSVNWLIGDVLNIPLPEESFELITDRACFHHIPDAQRQRYADEIGRLLKPNGVFVVRGASERRHPFFPVSKSEIEKYFSNGKFQLGTFLPVYLLNNSGGLTANMGIVRKLEVTSIH